MSRFYTLGLPRSRSVWLSMLLTDEHSDCFHEALTAFGSTSLPPSAKPFRGSADTNPLNPVVRSGRVVIIDRQIDDCIRSFVESFDNPFGDKPFEPFVAGWAAMCKERLDQFTGVERVQFHELDDPGRVCRLADYLRPGTSLSRKRAEAMISTLIRTRNRDMSQSVLKTAMYLRVSVDDFYQSVVSGKAILS